MLLGSGVTVKSTSTSLTLFTATIDFLRMSVNIGFLLCLRAFLINLYRSDIFIAKNAKLVRWSAHLLVLGTFIIMVSLHLEQATRVIVSLTSVIC